MVTEVETGHISDARALEAEITTYYWTRRKVDPWALYGLNVLRRRAECLHRLPTATQRLEGAILYFGPQHSSALPRNPIQYYYALTNLVGNLICSGRFTEAYARAVELEQVVHNFAQLYWPALDIAANNFIVASYLIGKIEVSTAVSLMKEALQGATETGDCVLMQNNYAVFLSRAGREREAKALLQRTYAQVIASSDPDEYHCYFVGNNLAVLHALEGEQIIAERLYRECSMRLERMYPAIRETLQKRHELLGPIFAEAAELDTESFDGYLLKNYPLQIGPQWAFYGRGFLISDIQFWSTD
jgi:hypothetical protein